MARRSGASTAMAGRSQSHRRRGLRRRAAAPVAAAAARVLDRPRGRGALGQDHLCALRRQRLLDPARSRGPRADAGRIRHRGAHPRWRAPDRPPSPQLQPTADGSRSGASAGTAKHQAQGTSNPRAQAVWSWPFPRARTCWSGPSPMANRPAHQIAHLLQLLDRYGARAMRGAVREALERNTPRAASVAFLLRQSNRATPLPLDLSRHPQAESARSPPTRSGDLR